MVTIEPGNASQIGDMMNLLRPPQVESPDSMEMVRLCVDNYPCFVAFNDQRKLKGLLYTIETSIDMLHIHGLHVDEALRGKKIGSLLLGETERLAKKLGYRTVTLTNSMLYRGEGKRSAVPFYEKHGYQINLVTPSDPPTYSMHKHLKV